MKKKQFKQTVHDLRGNLHAIEIAVLVLENGCTGDDLASLLKTLRKELSEAKHCLDVLVRERE